MFGRATIRLGIGPHSSCFYSLSFGFLLPVDRMLHVIIMHCIVQWLQAMLLYRQVKW